MKNDAITYMPRAYSVNYSQKIHQRHSDRQNVSFQRRFFQQKNLMNQVKTIVTKKITTPLQKFWKKHISIMLPTKRSRYKQNFISSAGAAIGAGVGVGGGAVAAYHYVKAVPETVGIHSSISSPFVKPLIPLLSIPVKVVFGLTNLVGNTAVSIIRLPYDFISAL